MTITLIESYQWYTVKKGRILRHTVIKQYYKYFQNMLYAVYIGVYTDINGINCWNTIEDS